MKVLHIGKYFPPRYGGIETFMSQLMEEQANRGLEVSAIVHADTLQSTTGCYSWNDCKIYEVKSYGQLVFAPIAPSYPFKLIRVLQKQPPDILHIHMPNLSAFWILFLRAFFTRQSKIIVHWHADVLGSAPTRLVRCFYPVYRVFERWLLKITDKVIATSPPYLETSIPLKPFRNKCVVIPLGIKIKSCDIKDRKYSIDGILRLCMIGRLVYYKGHSVVLGALKQLLKRNIPFTLDVIGDGELSSSLRKECTELGLDGNVTWHGSISEIRKDEILQSSDILLLPSLERTEAFGVVLLEAANYGVPALVSDVVGSGMSFVIDNGKNGIVIANCSESSIVSALLEVLKNKRLNLFGVSSFYKLRKYFDITCVATKTTNEYRRVLDNNAF